MKIRTVSWSWRFHQSHYSLSTSKMMPPENVPLLDPVFDDSYDSDSGYESAEFSIPNPKPCLRRQRSVANLGYVSDSEGECTSSGKVTKEECTSGDDVTEGCTSSVQANEEKDHRPGEEKGEEKEEEEGETEMGEGKEFSSGDNVTEEEKRKEFAAKFMAALLQVVKEQEEKLEEEKWKQRIILFLHKEMTELKESMNMLELAVTTIHDRLKEGQF